MIKNREYWIILSVLSLALSGLYSIFIVLLRTPALSNLFTDKSIFKTALIVHVDLSVLFWLVSFSMMISTLKINDKFSYLTKICQHIILISIFLIFISPIFGEAEPYMNNYVPILHNFFFIVGLALFFTAFSLVSVITFIYSDSVGKSFALISIFSIFSFLISNYKITLIEYPIDHHNFYEMLFWGGGHLLQYLYVSCLIYVYFEFSKKVDHSVSKEVFLWLNALLVIPMPLAQMTLPVDDSLYFDMFTQHMRIAGALAFIAAMISIIVSASYSKDFALRKYLTISNSQESMSGYAFLLSFFLFTAGGIIAIRIHEVNVVIPAHYHGSIVGITIALMGYVYLEVEKYFSSVNFKSAIYQLILYSIGQFIHISALAYSGGYGALRKTPGVELPLNAKIAMGFMGFGGLLAIVGGLIFVYICSKSIFRKYVN